MQRQHLVKHTVKTHYVLSLHRRFALFAGGSQINLLIYYLLYITFVKPNLVAMPNRRKLWSFKEELLIKSTEVMLSAVQTFNNPNVRFKSETFVILSNIAWTYLLHAHYRTRKIEYRWYREINSRTKRGAFKYWELERCLDDKDCPIDKVVISNLKFPIGLRHEIEHQMTTRLDDYLSARFQACCLNFNSVIKTMFGESYGIETLIVLITIFYNYRRSCYSTQTLY
jgi:hypothetical protein